MQTVGHFGKAKTFLPIKAIIWASQPFPEFCIKDSMLCEQIAIPSKFGKFIAYVAKIRKHISLQPKKTKIIKHCQRYLGIYVQNLFLARQVSLTVKSSCCGFGTLLALKSLMSFFA